VIVPPALLLSALALCQSPAPSTAAVRAAYAEADDLYLHRNRGRDLELSVSVLEGRLAQDPADAQALWRLGRSLLRLGEEARGTEERLALFERAEGSIERSLRIDERSAEAHYWCGLAMGRAGQERGMLRSLFLVGPIRRHMRRALELDPRMGRAHQVLGEMAKEIPGFAGGSKRRAVAELEEAVRLSPGYSAAYISLAKACVEVGEKEKARAVLRRVLELKAPDDPAEHGENVAEAGRMLSELGP